ncbi:glycosyltransferase family 2 protein [Pseudomonas yamanorum]|uniref:glycosyltransferase family 2 protein n=1 Tax=Pseudomonas yamanorum TaxID=515393 RepID=UPI001C4963B6|nr:glycosyltransferase family 2 protein [Pseudomonas yamanorum]
MTAKISVMVPVYNSQKYLRECLDSIFSQDYDNFEVIVSDDASTDGGQEILKEYAAKYKNMVLLLNEKNLGITDNCDQALQACDGKYIVLFAGDDIMLPGKLSMQVSFMELHPDVSISYHSVEIYNSDTNTVLGYTSSTPADETNNTVDIITKMGIDGSMSIMSRSSMVPKDIYRTNVKYISDWLFQIEVSLAGRVVMLPGVWCKYRKYGTNNGKELSRYIHEFEEVIGYVKTKYSKNTQLVEACNVGLARFLAGEAFRNITAGDKEQARKNLRRAVSLDKKLVYILAYIFSFVPLGAGSLNQIKYRVKKVLSKLGLL